MIKISKKYSPNKNNTKTTKQIKTTNNNVTNNNVYTGNPTNIFICNIPIIIFY